MWSKEENEQLKENILEYCKVRELEIGGRWGSQLVSALSRFWVERSMFKTWLGQSVVFLGKMLNIHSASLHSEV